MKSLIKIVSLTLALCMSLHISAAALSMDAETEGLIQPSITSLNENDALLIASSVLNSSDSTEDILKSGTTAKNVIPLYSQNGTVVAHYVSFDPTGYAVVNNNNANPTIIEFGEGANHLIANILNENPNAYIIYNNPTEIYAVNTQLSQASAVENTDAAVDLYTYFPDLKYENINAVSQLSQLKALVNSDVNVCGDGDYGFIGWDNMPSGSYTAGVLTGASSTVWAKMSDYDDIARYHCGATAITNMALYYATVGYNYLKIQDVDTTFAMVYSITGKGPKASITADAQEYFDNCGYTLAVSVLNATTFSNIVSAIGRNHPCGVLLENALFAWHWVVCVGFRQYNSGANYMRIVTGWSNSTRYFYSPNSGSTVAYVGEFAIV